MSKRGWDIPELDPEARREAEVWANRYVVMKAVKRATAADGRQQSEVIREILPELATELMALGSSKSAKVGAKASASNSADRRAKIGAWLIANYNRESYAKRGAKTRALHEAREVFGEPLDDKTLRLIAKEMRLTD